jgi:hypothetical protein
VTRGFGSETGVAATVLLFGVAGSLLFGGTLPAAGGPGDDDTHSHSGNDNDTHSHSGNHNDTHSDSRNGSPGRPGEAHAHCQFVPSNSPSVCRESRPDGSNARGGDGTNGTDGPGGRNGRDGANSTYSGAS